MPKKVKITWKNKELEGLLLPSPDDNIYILKLKSGYNVGINKKEVKKIEILEEITGTTPKENGGEEDGDISILGAGGTISSKIDYETGAVYPSISANELKMQFPELDKIASINARSILNIFSEEMTPKHWELIAEETYSELKKGKPVILLHGTDTMIYTAAALSFAITTDKPVIVVGAQRSSDRPSSDNKENLLNAVFSAKQDFGEVTVCMHASSSDNFAYLHRGVKVRKMHSSRRDAFKSINIRPLARVHHSGIFEKMEPMLKEDKVDLSNGFSEDVSLLYAYPGLKPEIIEAFKGKKGLVIAGTGLGHIAFEKIGKNIKKLIEDGTYVYMTTQTLNGRVNMNVYSTGRRQQDIGIKGNLNDMLPEVAYVKLAWAVNKAKNIEEVDELMNTNLKGEFSERSKYL